MNWKEEFIKLLEAGAFKTDSEIDDYADEHNLPAADVWQCFAEYRDDYLISIILYIYFSNLIFGNSVQ